MSRYNTIMHQLLTLVPRHQFDKLANGLDADRYVKTFTTWNQFSTLLYEQAGGKQSLRDIQNGLEAQGGKLYLRSLAQIAKNLVSQVVIETPNTMRTSALVAHMTAHINGVLRPISDGLI